MIPLKKSLSSSVGRKFFMALSGLALVGFVIMHLLGNLTLLVPGGSAFNTYAHKLESLGGLLYVAEVGLVFMFLIHIITAFRLKAQNSSARPVKYKHRGVTKGGESKRNLSSVNMIITGSVILFFLIVHIRQFKFGPSISAGYTAMLGSDEVRDLHRLVVETFKQPISVGFYVVVMLLLGFHLRHGFWSAFQSLGMQNPRFSKPIYGLGVALAILLAVGFLIIPLWIYFDILGVYV